VLTETEFNLLNTLNNLPFLNEPIIHIVSENNIGNLEAQQKISINLPGFEGKVTMNVKEHVVKALNNSNINVITGDEINSLISGGNPCFGNYFLSEDAGEINGRINTALGDFLVRSLSTSKVVVFKANSSMSSSCEECDGDHDVVHEGEGKNCQTFDKSVNPESLNSITHKNAGPNVSDYFINDSRCRIDFVAAVTPNASSNPGWARSDALATERDMNLALRNSGVENLSYRLVGFKELSTFSFANESNPATILATATANQEILNIYTDFGADVVLVFYQNEGLRGNRGWSEIGSASPENRDLSLSEINLTFQFTGVHELAHNHGCKHRIDPTVGTIGQLVLTARGHRIDPNDPDDDDIIVERTIMAINARDRSEGQQVDGKRVLRFSNPSVLWYDWVRDTSFPTGTAGNNNAAQMSVHGCTLAGLRDPLIEGISLDGPLRSSPGSIISVYSDRRCNGGVIPVVTYEASVDGGPFVVFGTGGSSISFSVPNNTANSVQFRATITCSPGNSYSDIHTVTIRQPCGPIGVLGRNSIIDSSAFPASRVEYQVVSSNKSQLSISWGEHNRGYVQVVDLLGRVLWQGDIAADILSSTIDLDRVRGQSDIIIVSYSDGKVIHSKKIHVN